MDNGAYAVEWDSSQNAFTVRDREANRMLLFRPFAGDIEHVKESSWFAPNSGEDFRAKNFNEVTYRRAVEAAGPVYHALRVTGNLLTLKTTEYPAAWVEARAVSFRGLKRVDILTELHTYPRMGFLAFAELEPGMEEPRVLRDFPFGEEESLKEDFSALHYVRLAVPGHSVLLAHSGHQQFFHTRRGERTVLRNMIARLTLKGTYSWHWSLTTGTSFTPAQSYRFAESMFGPFTDVGGAPKRETHGMVSVNDPAVVIFRFARRGGKATLWLANYSDQGRKARLDFSTAYRDAHRTDLEGNVAAEHPPLLSSRGRKLEMNLSPWEIAALELSGASTAPHPAA